MGREEVQTRTLTPTQRLSEIRSIIREMESKLPAAPEEQLPLLRATIVNIIRAAGPQLSGKKRRSTRG